MAYISASGTIGEKQPWSISSLVAMFWGFLNFIVMFFKTMFNPDMNKQGNRYTRDYRPGPGPPRPPRRKMGGFGSSMDASCGGGPMGGGG